MEPIRWTTRWDTWRALMGTPSSRQRRDVMALLETRPALLYWGDSWFSTPLYRNLAKQSLARIDGLAMLVGKPGATARELFSDAEVRRMRGWLEHSPFDALLLSAGGNDQLGPRLAQVFRAWMPPRQQARLSAADAYARLQDAGGFARILDRYVALLDALAPLARDRPHFRVVGHTYCRLRRIGVPAELTLSNIGLIAWAKHDVGPWLWGPMQYVLHDTDEARAFADLLLQGFRAQVLDALVRTHGALFSYADLLSVPGADHDAFWNDEIHPTEAGFAELAIPLNACLRARLPAAKQAAVR